MDDVLNCLETNKTIFNQLVEKRKSQNKMPLIMTFLMPNTNFFDIVRLIKLSELHRKGFYLLLVIEESEQQEELNFFMKVINKFVPNNKKIVLYEDILRDLLLNREYASLILSYKTHNLEKFNNYPGMGNLSLSDLNRFLTQYFILKNSKLFIGQEPDFFLTTSYKNIFFKSIPNFDDAELPVKIILKNISLNWNFKSSIKILERKMIKNKNSAKEIFSLKKSLLPIEPLVQEEIRNKDFVSIVLVIKKFLELSDTKQECFATKSNFPNMIFILNNETRRSIISILAKNEKIKAEEIRKNINLGLKKKHSLAGIVKHLNLLIISNLIYKKKRIYGLNTKRIILDIPISWFLPK